MVPFFTFLGVVTHSISFGTKLRRLSRVHSSNPSRMQMILLSFDVLTNLICHSRKERFGWRDRFCVSFAFVAAVVLNKIVLVSLANNTMLSVLKSWTQRDRFS